MKRKIFAAVLASVLFLSNTVAALTPKDFQYGSLSGVVEREDGTLLISDTFNKVIWEVDRDTVTVSAGQISVPGLDGAPIGIYRDGTRDTALFMEPWAIVPFMDGYAVSDTTAHVVRFLDDEAVRTVVGTGEAGFKDGHGIKASFNQPTGLAVHPDTGVLYIADTGNGAVRKFAEGRVTTLANVSSTPEVPTQPRGLLLRENGNLLVCDLFAQNILEVNTKPAAYRDVFAGTWCYDYVMEATERGLTSGTGNGYFTPNASVTRAMLVVMLSRMHQQSDGAAVINGDAAFSDVPEDAWYGEASRWAADLGVVNGYADGSFGAAKSINRQQLVTMLYRYAQAMGYDVSAGEDTNILSYTDAFEVSAYAIPAMQWACGVGIVSGYDDGSLRPMAPATRAQTVKILLTAMDVFGI